MRFTVNVAETIPAANPSGLAVGGEMAFRQLVERALCRRVRAQGYVWQIVGEPRRMGAIRLLPDGRGVLDVECELEVENHVRGDILVGAQVQTILPGVPVIAMLQDRFDYPPTTAVINDTANSEYLSKQQLVPLRVQASGARAALIVMCELLTCDTQYTVYRIDGPMTEDDVTRCAALRATIAEELTARGAAMADERRRERLWFFEKVLYAYREPATPEKDIEVISVPGDKARGLPAPPWAGPDVSWAPPVAGAVNILTLDYEKAEGSWARPLGLRRSSPLIARAEGGVPAPAGVVFESFLKNMVTHLRAMRELVETYLDPEVFQSHENIWRAMVARQQ